MYRYASVRSAHPRFSGAARSRGRVRRDVRRLYARNNPRPRPRAPGARAARKYYRMCSRGSCPSRGRASPYRAPGSPRRTRSWSRGVTDASRTTRSAGGGASELVRGASAGPRSAARRLLSGGGDAAARRRAPLPGRERGRSRPGAGTTTCGGRADACETGPASASRTCAPAAGPCFWQRLSLPAAPKGGLAPVCPSPPRPRCGR